MESLSIKAESAMATAHAFIHPDDAENDADKNGSEYAPEEPLQ